MTEPRQPRGVATRQSIIDAAVELFGEFGYGDIDMTDVVARAETTGGTCYYYFPTKSSLAVAIFEQSNEAITAAMEPIWESGAPEMHKLIAATFEFIAITENNRIARVGYQLRQAVHEVGRIGRSGFADTEFVFATAIRGAVRDGHARPGVNAEEAAYTLFATLVGCRLLTAQYGQDPFARLAQTWRTILPSIAAEDALPDLNRRVRAAARKRTGTTARKR